jgi:hypothetical protein
MSRQVTGSITAALLFFIISSPFTYQLTNNMLSTIVGRTSDGGCPTNTGLILHSAVYGLIVYHLMTN